MDCGLSELPLAHLWHLPQVFSRGCLQHHLSVAEASKRFIAHAAVAEASYAEVRSPGGQRGVGELSVCPSPSARG